MKAVALLVVAAIAALAGWRLDLRALLASYLAAWWFVTGALLGGLANVWLHQLTGGAWGETIRAPLLRAARWLPLACLLFLPVLLGAPLLYPWQHGVPGEPDAVFRHLWLSPMFFTVRSIVYLLLWSGFSVSLAAVDWIMSLQPAWYSSVFGWLAGTGQMLTGLALGVLLIDRGAARARLPDLGNLLMMYVLTWAYLAYVQFLIIWAADLPHEISWYLRRGAPAWQAVAWALVVGHFAGPLCILLSRHAKRAPGLLGVLAGALLAAHLLDCWWLVLPSVAHLTRHWLWLAPLVAAGFGGLAWMALAHARKERAHA
jgi:hypothetical protein